MLLEAVRNAVAQVGENILTSIHRHGPIYAKWTQIVKSAYMVVVAVGDENGIHKHLIAKSECLGIEIGPTVDKQIFPACFH